MGSSTLVAAHERRRDGSQELLAEPHICKHSAALRDSAPHRKLVESAHHIVVLVVAVLVAALLVVMVVEQHHDMQVEAH